MRTSNLFSIPGLLAVLGLAAGLALSFTPVAGRAGVLDNFNAASASGWEDANPGGLPLKGGQQGNGRFTFGLPALGQPFFVSSRKTSETFELKEGRTVEFRVDLLNGQGPDSFAIVGFIPQATGPNSLGGYGLAKSETDILITKGINKYFYDENPTPPVKNNNVTLVLNLAVRSGNVHITGQVLDKDDGNRVIWEKSFVDTPAADVLSDGKDDPSAPFVNLVGNFVLYLYADGGKDPAGYQVVYDNAVTYVTDATVLDDFNAATASGWEDANPANIPAIKGGAQSGGKFVFAMPPIGQPYFVSSKKTTRTYEISEGTRHEFTVDLDRGQGPDSFAILAWIPTSTGPNSLGGYGLAKSETDILITKGINKYFYNENPTPPIKNENVRLSLTLTAQDGNVILRARIFDKSEGDKVLFDKTFVDTAAADVMSDGKDDPSAPFLTTGNAVLYLYADGGKDPAGYTVQYDDLVVAAPPSAANQRPIVAGLAPAVGANYLAASAQLSFQVTDDKPLVDAGISVTLNGTTYTTANGLKLTGTGNSRTVSLSGFDANRNYSGQFSVTDSDNATTTGDLAFDTFTSANRVIEIEDYNYDGGSFVNNPVRSPEAAGIADNSFTDRVGVQGIDFNETRTAPRAQDAPYRTLDAIRMARSLDRRRALHDNDQSVYDYDVGDLAAGEWMNYTRNFTAGTYEIYLREAVVNLAQGESILERVTSAANSAGQTTEILGSFIRKTTGFTFHNVPLTDGAGLTTVKARLSGEVTLRLRTVTPDTDTGNRLLNYLVFVPVADTGVQRPSVAALSPAASATVDGLTPAIEVTIQNKDTQVDVASLRLSLNGAAVSNPTLTKTPTGATLKYAISPLPASGSANTAVVTFKDTEGVESRTEWQFTLRYTSLDAATRLSAKGRKEGFNLHVVQAPLDGGSLENSLDRAENQLANGSSIPRVVDTNAVVTLINLNKRLGSTDGYFPDDASVPGIDPDTTANADNDFAVEILTYLELPAGAHRFGARTDDGYKVASGTPPIAAAVVPIAFHNGGAADETFEFYVPQAGIYAFRMVWYERGGSGFAEWYSVNLTTGERTLINDAAAGSIKAWSEIDLVAAEISVESSASVSGGYAPDTAATVNISTKTATVPVGAGSRFFRLKSASPLTIKSSSLQGGVLTLTWQ